MKPVLLNSFSEVTFKLLVNLSFVSYVIFILPEDYIIHNGQEILKILGHLWVKRDTYIQSVDVQNLFVCIIFNHYWYPIWGKLKEWERRDRNNGVNRVPDFSATRPSSTRCSATRRSATKTFSFKDLQLQRPSAIRLRA